MIIRVEHYFTHRDSRGSITGLINDGVWKEFNIITSESDIIRGNHYHKHTTELFMILEGCIKVKTQYVHDGQLIGEISEDKVHANDVFLIRPLINHTFEVLEASRWINVLSEKMDEENLDMFCIEESR